MAEKELRHMSRTELIEIIYALQQEEQSLQQENEDLKSQLDERVISLENAGSIAEASLQLNHIFEDAQSAADQYLLSVKEMQKNAASAGDEMISAARKKARRIVSSARKQAERTRQPGGQEDDG